MIHVIVGACGPGFENKFLLPLGSFGGNFVLPELQPGRVAQHPTPVSPAAPASPLPHVGLCAPPQDLGLASPLPGPPVSHMCKSCVHSLTARSLLRCHLPGAVFLDLHPPTTILSYQT